ncbi:hypothetical protein DSO57_1015053 [Entomophthora muscae]|uniref:Uncharacterized protein n=1 Tax=Entomophthora muscae TaxID=34485 RepID=A0ACC2TT19_9FUNG|nr:hypothetical protein DSO57_1015053 [Entomophthora muscae]
MDFYFKDFDPDFEETLAVPLPFKNVSLDSRNRHLKSRQVLSGSGYDQKQDTFFVHKQAREGMYIRDGFLANERSLDQLLDQSPDGPIVQIQDELPPTFNSCFDGFQASTLFGTTTCTRGSKELSCNVNNDHVWLELSELIDGTEAPHPVERARAALKASSIRRQRGHSLNYNIDVPNKMDEITHGDAEGIQAPRPSKRNKARTLLRSIVSLLLGFGSDIFVFNNASSQFETRLDSLLSSEDSQVLECSKQFRRASLLSLLQQFTAFGTLHKKLAQISAIYIDSPREFGVLGASLGKALGSYLHVVGMIVISAFSDILPSIEAHSLLLIWNRLQATFEVFQALAGFFDGIAEGPVLWGSIPRREAVLDRLYGFIRKHMTYPLTLPLCVLYNMYSQTCTPYFTWISDVLCIPHKSRCSSFSSHAAPRDDPFEEFFVSSNDSNCDRIGEFPESLFDQALVQKILESIQGLKILKEHCPHHPIFQEGSPADPYLALRFSSDALLHSSTLWKARIQQMIETIKRFITTPLSPHLQSYLYAYQGNCKKLQLPFRESENYPIDYAVFSKPPMSSLVGCTDMNIQSIEQLIRTRDSFKPDQDNFDQISESLLELNLIIDASFKTKVYEQCQLINRSVHHYMLKLGGLEQYLSFLEGFFLLSYGPFVSSLGPYLADALQIDSQVSSRSLMRSLTIMLDQTFSEHPLGCLFPTKNPFKFTCDMARVPEDFLSSIGLLLTPAPPINNVIDQSMLKAYEKMFKLLAKLHGISVLLSRQRPPRCSNRIVFLAYKTASHFITSLQSYMHDRVARAHHKSLKAAFVTDPFSGLSSQAGTDLSGIALLIETQQKWTRRMLLFALCDATLVTAEECLGTCIKSTLKIVSLLIQVYPRETALDLARLYRLVREFQNERAQLAAELKFAVDHHGFCGAGHTGSDLGLDNPFLLLISFLL